MNNLPSSHKRQTQFTFISQKANPLMAIVPQENQTSNNYFSSTARSEKPKVLKLHSSDIAYLQTLAWFRSVGNRCYLSPEQWPEWLVRFGGKASRYQTQKERWAKMRALGYAFSEFQNGNRSLHKEHHITDSGLQALADWENKNRTAKSKKPPLERKKTVPPLKIRSKIYENHEDDVFDYPKSPPKSPPITHPVIEQLKGFGMYEGLARKLFMSKGENSIRYAIDITNKRKINKPGAYISRLLMNPIYDNKKYNLEEKSENEKVQQSQGIASNVFEHLKQIAVGSNHILGALGL